MNKKITLKKLKEHNDHKSKFSYSKLEEIKKQRLDSSIYKSWQCYGSLNIEVKENEEVYLWECFVENNLSGEGFVVIDNKTDVIINYGIYY